jgi:hypothetical protein
MIAQTKHVLVDWSLKQYQILDKEIDARKPDIILADCVSIASHLLVHR